MLFRSSIGNAEEVLEEVFPGHNLTQWKEKHDTRQGYAERAISFIQDRLASGWEMDLQKSDLRDALGIRVSSGLTQNVLNRGAFLQFLADNGLEMTTRTIRRVQSAFDPI